MFPKRHPHDSSLTERRRYRGAVLAVGMLAASLTPAVIGSPADAASPACIPHGFTASAGADLLSLHSLDLSAVTDIDPITNVVVGRTRTDMARTTAAHTTADARTLAGLPALPPALLAAHAHQAAPPAHAAPSQVSTIALDTSLLNFGAGNLLASAGQPGSASCAQATANASVADAQLLDGDLLDIPDNLSSNTHTAVISHNGHAASAATASAGLAAFSLLTGSPFEVDAQVISQPFLTGIAGGSVASSSVTYHAPTLRVNLPDGTVHTLNATHSSLDFTIALDTDFANTMLRQAKLPAIKAADTITSLSVDLSLGTAHKSITAHQLSASASTLQVQLSLNTTDLPIPVSTITPTDLPTDLPTLDGTADVAPVPAAQPQRAAAIAAPDVVVPLLNLGIGALTVTAAAPTAGTPCTYNSCAPSKPCAYGCNPYTAHTTATKTTTATKATKTTTIPKASITFGKTGAVQKANLASADLPAASSSNPTGVIALIIIAGGLLAFASRYILVRVRSRDAN